MPPSAPRPKPLVVFDEVMLAHAHIPHLQKKHPEKPSRITTVRDHLDALGLLARCECGAVSPREATEVEILRAHSAEHLQEVVSLSARVAADPDNRELREPDGPGGIYYSPESDRTARIAAGVVIDISLRLLDARAEAAAREAARLGAGSEAAATPASPPPPLSALALVRPPGHHAGYDDTPGHRAEGFCFYNSVACAARAAIASGRAARVLIVDYDVHHGNGTERIFYDSPDVLYVSVHRYGRSFYPETGALDDVGEGAGVGYTLNVPWLHTGFGDAEYLAAWHLLVLPVARAFGAGLVLVSAGFDAADGDVQGGMRVSPAGFAQMTLGLGQLGAPMVLALEGGYNQVVTAKCVAEVLRALLGDVRPVEPLDDGAARSAVSAHAEAQIRAVLQVQAAHWPVLRSDEHIALVEGFFERAHRMGGGTRSSPRNQRAFGGAADAPRAADGARAKAHKRSRLGAVGGGSGADGAAQAGAAAAAAVAAARD